MWLVIVVLLLGAALLLLKKYYIVVPPNQFLVVVGPRRVRYVTGRGTLVFPFIQEPHRVDTEVHEFALDVKDAETGAHSQNSGSPERVRINISGSVSWRILPNQAAAMAAIRSFGVPPQPERISERIDGIVIAAVVRLVGSRSAEEILGNQREFAEAVLGDVNQTLDENELGCTVVAVAIKQIADAEGSNLILTLSRRALSRVEADAKIAEINAQSRELLAERERIEAKQQRDLTEAEAKRTAGQRLRQAELELIETEVRYEAGFLQTRAFAEAKAKASFTQQIADILSQPGIDNSVRQILLVRWLLDAVPDMIKALGEANTRVAEQIANGLKSVDEIKLFASGGGLSGLGGIDPVSIGKLWEVLNTTGVISGIQQVFGEGATAALKSAAPQVLGPGRTPAIEDSVEVPQPEALPATPPPEQVGGPTAAVELPQTTAQPAAPEQPPPEPPAESRPPET